ncbi:MAG: hypothetical protein CBC83_00465 [Flavobacteriales bacterium TMED123]|nr:MAG: hypothetical protein CBC83_00465 [Flavobacteriales bacterium TMED123]
MNIYCYFVEPASYTLDLAKYVYDQNNIDYCFIKSSSYAKSKQKTCKLCLQNQSVYKRLKHLITIFRKHDLIIINGYNNYPFILTFLFNFFSRKKKYIAIESDTQFAIPKNLLIRFAKWIYLNMIFRNKYVLGFAGGNFTHKKLFSYYGMEQDRIFLMPMIVDNFKFYQEQKQFPTTFTFLYVGRLVKHKNVEGVIRQFNRYFSDKNVILRIVGSGNEGDRLRRKYASEKVLFLGKKVVPELIKEFQDSSCFLCPSLFEPWGLVVNEAMSSGLPVIATKYVGASFDLIKDKETGFVVEDMNDFGAKMLDLYNDPELLIKFSVNATKLMKESWNYGLYDNCLKTVIKRINNVGKFSY